MELVINWWLGNLFLIAFFVFYRLILQSSNSFNWNRAYLIVAPILSFSLPFLGRLFPAQTSAPIQSYMLEGITVLSEQTAPVAADDSITWWAWLYVAGISIFLLRLIWTSGHLSRLIIRAKKEAQDGFILLKSNDEISSFSFFKYVHIQPNLNQHQQQAVLKHELVHVNSGHSFDILFFELLVAILWFNPVVFLYRSAIREVHEFAADSQAAKNQEQDYSQLLVAQAMGVSPAMIVNPFFNQSLLKRRIMMLNTKTKKSTWKYVFILPLACVLFYTASCTKGEESGTKTVQNQSQTKESDAIVDMSDLTVKPEFKGGQQKLFEFIGSELKYPPEAKKEGTEGTVYVNFTISETGVVKDVTVLKGVNEELDAAAKAVIEQMPDWTPAEKAGKLVATKFTIPIKFKMSD